MNETFLTIIPSVCVVLNWNPSVRSAPPKSKLGRSRLTQSLPATLRSACITNCDRHAKRSHLRGSRRCVSVCVFLRSERLDDTLYLYSIQLCSSRTGYISIRNEPASIKDKIRVQLCVFWSWCLLFSCLESVLLENRCRKGFCANMGNLSSLVYSSEEKTK